MYTQATVSYNRLSGLAKKRFDSEEKSVESTWATVLARGKNEAVPEAKVMIRRVSVQAETPN